jgi:hypothetical protein
MSEVSGNNLIERDTETNAIIPVMQIYSEDMENKEVDGNYLVVRDPATNAIVPVVEVLGGDKKGKFKGYYSSESLLTDTYPAPKAGDYAYVGDPYPGTVYNCETEGTWVDTEDIPPVPDSADWNQGW